MKLKLSILVLWGASIFTACQKENIDKITPNEPTIKVDTVDVNPYIADLKAFNPDTIYLDCIKIPFPVNFRQESGSTITISSDSQLQNAQRLTDPIVDFVYPFDAVTRTGPKRMSSVEDIFLALIDCDTTTQNTNCADQDPHVLLFFNALDILTRNNYEYDINYPVTLLVEGTRKVLNDDDDYLPAIGGSPFNYPETELVYPISITQFGRTITLNNDDDVCRFYQTLDEDCTNKPAHIQFFYNEGAGTRISCSYFINYPVSISLNGVTKTINSRTEYISELNASPTAYSNITLNYPVNMRKYQGNQTVTFRADNEICAYLTNCR